MELGAPYTQRAGTFKSERFKESKSQEKDTIQELKEESKAEIKLEEQYQVLDGLRP